MGRYPLLRRCFEEAPVVDKNGYDYFVNPISDGVPRVYPDVLEEAVDGLVSEASFDCDLILAPEAMGIPLAAGISLKARIPFSVVRKKRYGLPGETELTQRTGYSKAAMFLNGLEKGTRVAIVDDVLDTGGTIFAVASAVRDAGAVVTKVAVVYAMSDVQAFSKKVGAPVVALLSVGVEGGRPFVRSA